MGTETVDRRVVVNPSQARALLAAVRELSPEVEGFFACLYYAGLRPSEAVNLREKDCLLPQSGWGELVLVGSHQTTGRAWTDSGDAGEERGLKHRSRDDTRHVPAHPELVAGLRRHLDQFLIGLDGRLFVARTGKRGIPPVPAVLEPPVHGDCASGLAQGQVKGLDPGAGSLSLGATPLRPTSCLPIDLAECRRPSHPGG